MKPLIVQIVQPPVTFLLLDQNILLSTVFSYTPNVCSFLRVRDQVSLSYIISANKNRSKIVSNYLGGVY